MGDLQVNFQESAPACIFNIFPWWNVWEKDEMMQLSTSLPSIIQGPRWKWHWCPERRVKKIVRKKCIYSISSKFPCLTDFFYIRWNILQDRILNSEWFLNHFLFDRMWLCLFIYTLTNWQCITFIKYCRYFLNFSICCHHLSICLHPLTSAISLMT